MSPDQLTFLTLISRHTSNNIYSSIAGHPRNLLWPGVTQFSLEQLVIAIESEHII